MIGLANRHHGE